MIILPLFLAAIAVTTPISTPTPLLTPTGSGSEIQKFKESISEKVKARLQEINQTTQLDLKRGYIGTITKISPTQINLDSKDKNQVIVLDTSTVYLNNKSTKIKITDLKIGQEILVIGLLDDQKNLLAKRIIITPLKSIQNLKTTVYGQVVDISTTSSVIALIPFSNKNTQYQIKTNTKNIQIISQTGEKLTLKDITKGKKIIIISTSSPISSQTISAEKIIVL